MALARYTYLPWLRRGIANAISAPAAAASRAKIAVSLALSDGTTTGPAIEKTFALMGPGDVIGLNPDVIIRTEPRSWVLDFEPNYLAFVEFFDEDFCWRHTPAPPDAGTHRLVPWITLLVLAEGEFERNLAPGRPLTSVRIKDPDVASYFPPTDQLWAWAHVQITGALGSGDVPDAGLLAGRLQSAPDSGVCRLVSPRRLMPNTAYTAFVVPTFEVGRKAGLGLTIHDDTEPGTALAWAEGAGEFPVYFDWYFRTGAGGDFEDLVQRMQARPVDARVGMRDIDIAAPGFGMPDVAEAVGPEHHAGVVGLEGALKAPTMQPKPLDPISTFPLEAAKIVNAPAEAQDAGEGDPVVAPPLTGGWHALINRVDPGGMERWLNDLNLDPRQRAASGLGARVLRANQERFMKLAWEQVGEVLAANRRAANLRFAQATADKLFARSLVTLPADRALALTAPVFARVLGSPQTIRGLLSASRVPNAVLSPAFRKLARPRGLFAKRALPLEQRRSAAGNIARATNDLRASAAPPSPPVAGPTLDQVADGIVQRQSGLAWFARWAWLFVLALLSLATLAAVTLAGAVGLAAAFALVAAAGGVAFAAAQARRVVASGRSLDLSQLSPASLPAVPPQDFSLSEPGAAARPVANPVEAADFAAAQREFANFIAARTAKAPLRPALDFANAHTKVMAAITPATAYPRRAARLIRIGERSIVDYVHEAYPAPPVGGDAPRIAPVMAYPDIKDAMYAPLAAISDELLVPNLGLVPPNTISLMLTNPAFIEAYMAGLNHEFARELLWREYPTDSRGSPFRQFWNVDAVQTPGLSGLDRVRKLKDIKPIHEWDTSGALGENPNPGRGAPGERAVLVLRGDLLKRYPNTIIYAQRARWSSDPAHVDELALFDEKGEKALAGIADPNFAYPIFTAPVAPDLTFVGFNLTLEEVRGDPTLEETAEARAAIPADKLGWFFVLQEVLAEPRLGLDETAPPLNMQSDYKWDNFCWADLSLPGKLIDVSLPLANEPPGDLSGGPNLIWRMNAGATAADVAGILNQKPVLTAWHARQMLARGTLDGDGA